MISKYLSVFNFVVNLILNTFSFQNFISKYFWKQNLVLDLIFGQKRQNICEKISVTIFNNRSQIMIECLSVTKKLKSVKKKLKSQFWSKIVTDYISVKIFRQKNFKSVKKILITIFKRSQIWSQIVTDISSVPIFRYKKQLIL